MNKLELYWVNGWNKSEVTKEVPGEQDWLWNLPQVDTQLLIVHVII